jgi:hypothetical protein
LAAVRNNAPVSFEYALDARGLAQSVTQTGDAPRFNTFHHDEVQPLKAAEYREAPAAPPLMDEVYAYDKAGNRTLKR